MIRTAIVSVIISALVGLGAHATAPVEPSVLIDPGAVSDAMNNALTAAGYDDATLPIPRSVAIHACQTDTDCHIAAGDPS